ncbi:MAG TPA: peptidase T [Candidatus Aphodousia faecigallinarum]|uniref:Peptidase T n=1 Tax=Candidatus Aphodousia faecigallinarum TaxID=2840677 RepID=A0A9D1LFB4_9BURK|nr:peptidase T [Candidatus Aphodousia faecigallinarum]
MDHHQKAQALVERFLSYLAISSQSDPKNKEVPSSEGQWTMARVLEAGLKEFGLQDVEVDEHGNVTGFLPGTVENVPTIGFVAHVDTVDVGLSPDVHPQVIHYKGGDVCLNKEKDIWIRVKEHPELERHVGEDIIFTDGTSVLGADNKSGVTNIMTALEIIITEQIPHGDIRVAFVPDEETGLRGSKLLDLDRFKVDFAYTVDGGEVGQIVYETYNAAEVHIDIEGVTTHPASAKGVLLNPNLIAVDLINNFNRLETPENTDVKEGYYWIKNMSGNPARAHVQINIRDFDDATFEARKQYVRDVVELTAKRYPRAKITADIEDIYRNISGGLGEDRYPIDVMYQALKELGIEPKTVAMRGGTDGSALTARGLVTPNYFTGSYNHHGYAEFMPIEGFVASLDMTLKVIELIAKGR